MINGLRGRFFESVEFTFILFSGFNIKADRLTIKLKGGNIINISMEVLFDILISKPDIRVF